MPKNFPVGTDNFSNLIRKDCLFCDKTLMIKTLLDRNEKVTLITRPRRWGKSLSLSMLQHFFSAKVGLDETKDMFKNLKIAKEEKGDYITKHQGRYPVIFINLKDVNQTTYEGTLNKMRLLIASVFGEHYELATSDKLSVAEKVLFQRFIERDVNVDESLLGESLKLLSHYLNNHHGTKVIILVDEYDTPINNAFTTDYLNKITVFMHNFFATTFKENRALERGIMVGILQVWKDNIQTYSLLDEPYKEHFGFTEQEMISLFNEQKCDAKLDDVRRWYHGYKLYDLVVYNPWSISCSLNDKGKIDVYWVNTANNDIVKHAIFNFGPDVRTKIQLLLEGRLISSQIDKYVTLDIKNNPLALWSLLLFTGYLKAETITFDIATGLYNCQLKIPNREVSTIYNRCLFEWLSGMLGQTKYNSLINNLESGDVAQLIVNLADYLLQVARAQDSQLELYYHGLVLALVAALNDQYQIFSNYHRELKRLSILLAPKLANKDVAINVELKAANKNDDIKMVAENLLNQIDIANYAAALKEHANVKTVLKVVLGYSIKSTLSMYHTIDLTGKSISQVKTSRELYFTYESDSDESSETDEKNIQRSKGKRKHTANAPAKSNDTTQKDQNGDQLKDAKQKESGIKPDEPLAKRSKPDTTIPAGSATLMTASINSPVFTPTAASSTAVRNAPDPSTPAAMDVVKNQSPSLTK